MRRLLNNQNTRSQNGINCPFFHIVVISQLVEVTNYKKLTLANR